MKKNEYKTKVAAMNLLKSAMDAMDSTVEAMREFENAFDLEPGMELLIERIQKIVPYDANIIREVLCAEETVLEEDEGWRDEDWEDEDE